MLDKLLNAILGVSKLDLCTLKETAIVKNLHCKRGKLQVFLLTECANFGELFGEGFFELRICHAP